MCEFEGWTSWLEPAFLLWKPGDHDYERDPDMTWKEEDEPEFTPEQELALMAQQVNNSDGFDIDFSKFRCIFNYHSAILNSHEFVEEPETTEDLLNMLSQKSLNDYNRKNKTEFEFVKVVKANFHWCCAYMFLITFQVKDPYDNIIKVFQARVRHARNIMTQYIFCRPKPDQQVECIGIAKKDVEKDVKKQRLE